MMLRKRKMIIIMKNQADGFMRTKEIRTYRSSLSMLKYLHKKALKMDPWARIIIIGNESNLVIHQAFGGAGVITVRVVEKETDLDD